MFMTQAERDAAKGETIVDIPLSLIDDFHDHPYQVRMDAEMLALVESIKQHGVLSPAHLRPKEGDRHEMVAGHRRKAAAVLAGLDTLPCIVRELTDDEATILMVDSNLYRETVLPSEKAFAYQMKLAAMKRQGRRTDLTSVPMGQKSDSKTSREMLAEEVGESGSQIQRYIQLTNLAPELLQMVDNIELGEKPQIAMRPAYELSFLTKEEQGELFTLIECEGATPSHAQSLKMRQFSKEGRLSEDVLLSIMQEQKPNQVEQFKLPKAKISRFFPGGASAEKMQETIVKALELYRRQQNRDTR